MFVVETSEHFDKEIIEFLDFLAQESPHRALHFYDDLMKNLEYVSTQPTMYHRREGMENHTRELVLQGYTVPLFVDEEAKKIIVLGIFNHRFWVTEGSLSDKSKQQKWGPPSHPNLPGPLSTTKCT